MSALITQIVPALNVADSPEVLVNVDRTFPGVLRQAMLKNSSNSVRIKAACDKAAGGQRKTAGGPVCVKEVGPQAQEVSTYLVKYPITSPFPRSVVTKFQGKFSRESLS